MTASVTVLGGSAAGGNTAAGCSGYLIRTPGSTFVLDFGPAVLPELRKHADFRTLDAIVISHLHLDHTLDLGLLRYALAYNPEPAPQPIPLWMPPGGLPFLRAWGAAFADAGKESEFFLRDFDVAEYDPSGSVTVGDATITFTRTVHYRPCWAMRVAVSGYRDLFYTADSGPAARLQTAAAGCDLVIAESGTLTGEGETWEERGHLTPEEAGTLAADAGAGTLLLTHLWEEYGFEEYRERAASTFSGRLDIARPGLTVELAPISNGIVR
jgi:ribonuclease BN (tRNA processing enzyme)